MRNISRALEVVSLIDHVHKSVREVKAEKERTVQMRLESEKRIQESDKQLRDSISRHDADIQNIEAHYDELNRIQQEKHDEQMRAAVEEMARVNKLMDENDASFDSMMAAIHDPNLSEDEKVAAVKAYQPKFR